MTVIYICYLFTFWSPWARLHILRVAKPVTAKKNEHSIRHTVVSVLQNCKIGDIYLLYRLRQHFSHARFYDLLIKLSDPNYLSGVLDGVSVDHKGGHPGDARHRGKPPQQHKPPAKYMDSMYTKPNKGILVE